MTLTKERAAEAKSKFLEFCDHVNANFDHAGVREIVRFFDDAVEEMPASLPPNAIDENDVVALWESLSDSERVTITDFARQSIASIGVPNEPPERFNLNGIQWRELLRYAIGKVRADDENARRDSQRLASSDGMTPSERAMSRTRDD